MSDLTDEHLKAVLNAIDDITPEPPPLLASPARPRARRQPLLVAAASFVVVLLSIGVGILALRLGAVQERDVATAPTTLVSQGLPHLVLDLPDTTITHAYEILDDSTGEPIGMYTEYDTEYFVGDTEALEALPEVTNTTAGPINTDAKVTWPEVTNTTAGPGETATTATAMADVKVQLSLYKSTVDVERFDNELRKFLDRSEGWAAAAENIETIAVAGREVTIYTFSEVFVDQVLLRWTETPGYDAILIPWGLGPDGALTLMDGLTIASDDEWSQLTSR